MSPLDPLRVGEHLHGHLGWLAAIGVSLYPSYRETLKQSIFAGSPTIGYLFERKEHLAFGAVMLAWTGGVGYVAERLSEGSLRAALRRVAHYAFVAAAAFAVITAALGTLVASYKTF